MTENSTFRTASFYYKKNIYLTDYRNPFKMSIENSIPGELSPRRKYAVRISASLVHRDQTLIAANFKQALNGTFQPDEIVELILQSLLFDGYPCALEGLITLKSVIPSILPAREVYEGYSSANLAIWKSRGDSLCRRIYGSNFDALIRNVEALSSTLREWMLVEGYGRVLSRSRLSIDLRELGIVAMLIVKRYPRQLHSHMRGALNVGVSSSDLRASIELCAEYTSEKQIITALDIWKRLMDRKLP